MCQVQNSAKQSMVQTFALNSSGSREMNLDASEIPWFGNMSGVLVY